jgi:hypothetical protein
MTEDDDQNMCDGCGFTGAPLEDYPSQRLDVEATEDRHLCALCASTYVGNAIDFPGQYPDMRAMQAVVYCANVLLQRLDAIERKLGM